jgi:hypothetical protein
MNLRGKRHVNKIGMDTFKREKYEGEEEREERER